MMGAAQLHVVPPACALLSLGGALLLSIPTSHCGRPRAAGLPSSATHAPAAARASFDTAGSLGPREIPQTSGDESAVSPTCTPDAPAPSLLACLGLALGSTCASGLRMGAGARRAATASAAPSKADAGEVAASRAAIAFDVAPLAMLITDSRDTVAQANAAAERLFGRGRGGLSGAGLESLLPGGRDALAPRSPSDAKPGRTRQAYAQLADGEFLAVDVVIDAIACDGGPAVLYSLVSRGEMRGLEDELARLAERLRAQNQELGRRNEELDEFTYVASHDLQEPLRKLVAFSELLSADAGPELPERAASDLRHIIDAASRMRQLIDDLLELSRTARSELRLQPVPLDACVDAALERLATRVEESGARIAREPLPTVHGDATLLTQLFQNLLGNALKFVAAGTTPDVHISARRAAEAGHWLLGVIDNGIGLRPEYAERIFAPFKRLHSRAEYPGSGVGLAICRRAVERHGGRIWVESSPGRGAHFRFTLPEGRVS